MKIVKCEKCGHMYNKDRYVRCPKCSDKKKTTHGKTVALWSSGSTGISKEYKANEDDVSGAYLIKENADDINDKVYINGNEFIIGRSQSSDMLLDDDLNMSRSHAKITVEDGRYYIIDLESTNGTFLNQKELKPQKKYLLCKGDILTFYNVSYLFDFDGE